MGNRPFQLLLSLIDVQQNRPVIAKNDRPNDVKTQFTKTKVRIFKRCIKNNYTFVINDS